LREIRIGCVRQGFGSITMTYNRFLEITSKRIPPFWNLPWAISYGLPELSLIAIFFADYIHINLLRAGIASSGLSITAVAATLHMLIIAATPCG
jgi:hypothetical protein